MLVSLELLCFRPHPFLFLPLGVQLLTQSLLITTSADQRLSVWSLAPKEVAGKEGGEQRDTLYLCRVGSLVHDVADAASLVAYQAK